MPTRGPSSGQRSSIGGGYDVEDGELTFYYGRRLPLGVVFGLLALGVAALVALGVWAAFRIRRDARRKAELAAFRETLASGREDERLRLARELHDGPLQEFNAVRLALEAIGAPKDLRADLLAAIQEVRGVVQDLRPPALERGGLDEALEGLAVRFRRRHPGLYVEAEIDGDGSTLPREDQLAVYRVCQEALTNVAKHGDASAVWVGYREAGGAFVLTVEDDGVGFDSSPGAAASAGRFGLAGIRERAEAIGAEVGVASRQGNGTRLTLACGAVPSAVGRPFRRAAQVA